MAQTTQIKRDIFTVRIVYKSGYTHDFDVYNFKKEGRRIEYECADFVKRPLDLGNEEIAAIWQIGHKSAQANSGGSGGKVKAKEETNGGETTEK